MKRFLSIIITLLIVFTSCICVYAAQGNVTYDGNSQEFVFKPGSEHSLTDLFTEFKDVMPGDSITQKITVKNTASNKVKVKIYMRSLGAQPESKDFLSQLKLKVAKSSNNEMAYMFDAAANEKAQLTDWVELGTLYSGGEVNLDVILEVPKELDNTYKQKIGYLDWEFKVEELSVEENDPQPPQTGDNSNIFLWIVLMLASGTALFLIILLNKKRQK